MPARYAGDTEASPCDQAVLERLADSMIALPEDQQQAVLQANPGAATLAQLREFVLATLLRRYLARCHIPADGAQRSAVNAVRLLEVSWVGDGGWLGLLLAGLCWKCHRFLTKPCNAALLLPRQSWSS